MKLKIDKLSKESPDDRTWKNRNHSEENDSKMARKSLLQ